MGDILFSIFIGAFFPLMMWWINTDDFGEPRGSRVFACTVLTMVSIAMGALWLKESPHSFIAYLIGAAPSYYGFFRSRIK